MKPSIVVSILALLSGLSLSLIAGYFSVLGIATIFAGAFVPVLVMAGALETSKIVAASWLYRNWSIAPTIMKVYLTTAVVVLVLITSMGIFGYLSKAHIDQVLIEGGNNEIQIENIDFEILEQQEKIDTAQKTVALLDEQVQTLQEYDKISGPSGAIETLRSQQPDREDLQRSISDARDILKELREKKSIFEAEKLQLEAEVGPIKYIAELIYEDEEIDFDKAVRLVTIILVLVFDPLAISLILAGNAGLAYNSKTKKPRNIGGTFFNIEKE